MSPELKALHLEAGRLAGEDKTCGKKVVYATYEASVKAALAHNNWKDRRHDVEAYPCYFCGNWHVGRVMDKAELSKIKFRRESGLRMRNKYGGIV